MRELPRREVLLGVLLLIVLSFGLYARILDGPFQFDDQTSVLENEALRGEIHNWWRYWPTRALTMTTLGWDWRRAATDPGPYHVTNVTLHALASLAALLLLWQLTLGLAASRRRWWCAVLGASLFAAHPLMVQSAAYIVQRATTLLALFSLLCIALYLRAATSQQHGGAWSIAAWCAGLLACLSKEPSIALPAALLLVDLARLPAKGRGRRWLPFAALWILPPLLLWQSNGALGNDSVRFLGQATRVDRWTYLWTQTEVVARYLGLALWPLRLNIDHDIAWRSTPFTLSWLVFACVHVVILGAAVLAHRRRRIAAAGAIFWIYLLLLPESSLFPIEDAMFEHRMVLPLFGVAWLLSLALLYAPRRWLWIATLVPLLLGAVTVQRVELWRDPLALWSDALVNSPAKARPHMAVGWLLGNRGELTRSREELLTAVRIDPDYAMAWNNLGVVAMRLADTSLAEEAYTQATRLHPEQAVLWSNRGHARLLGGNLSGAESDFRQALRIDPQFASALDGLERLGQRSFDQSQD